MKEKVKKEEGWRQIFFFPWVRWSPGNPRKNEKARGVSKAWREDAH